MKTFIKSEGHADFYPGLKINFIPGKPPHLVCFKGEEEVERIDLSDLATGACHDLVVSKGYKRQMPLSLAKKLEEGGEVADEDWAAYLEARESRRKAREAWVSSRAQRLLQAWDQAPKKPALGEAGTWLVEKEADQLTGTSGAGYRSTMVLADKAPREQMAKWGSELQGTLDGDGTWVKFATEWGERFLPVVVNEVRILRPLYGAASNKDEL